MVVANPKASTTSKTDPKADEDANKEQAMVDTGQQADPKADAVTNKEQRMVDAGQ